MKNPIMCFHVLYIPHLTPRAPQPICYVGIDSLRFSHFTYPVYIPSSKLRSIPPRLLRRKKLDMRILTPLLLLASTILAASIPGSPARLKYTVLEEFFRQSDLSTDDRTYDAVACPLPPPQPTLSHFLLADLERGDIVIRQFRTKGSKSAEVVPVPEDHRRFECVCGGRGAVRSAIPGASWAGTT